MRALSTFIKLMRATNSIRPRLERRLLAHGITGNLGALEASCAGEQQELGRL